MMYYLFENNFRIQTYNILFEVCMCRSTIWF